MNFLACIGERGLIFSSKHPCATLLEQLIFRWFQTESSDKIDTVSCAPTFVGLVFHLLVLTRFIGQRFLQIRESSLCRFVTGKNLLLKDHLNIHHPNQERPTGVTYMEASSSTKFYANPRQRLIFLLSSQIFEINYQSTPSSLW